MNGMHGLPARKNVEADYKPAKEVVIIPLKGKRLKSSALLQLSIFEFAYFSQIQN